MILIASEHVCTRFQELSEVVPELSGIVQEFWDDIPQFLMSF